MELRKPGPKPGTPQPQLEPWYFGKGEEHIRWKGGRIMKWGYIQIYMPTHKFVVQKYYPEHRLVYEESRNCCLLSPKIVSVHHIDGDKLNNIWYNLKAMSKREHRRLHAIEQWREGGSLRVKHWI